MGNLHKSQILQGQLGVMMRLAYKWNLGRTMAHYQIKRRLRSTPQDGGFVSEAVRVQD